MANPQPNSDECDHDPVWVKDWYGNPDIPNGTADCSHWECSICGEELEELPAGFEPDFDEPLDW